MEQHIEQFILSAESKAFATCADGGLNVVPVSSIKIVSGKIWLINYFMDKTLENIFKNENVALVCWRKMMGYQIKGTVSYMTAGEDFESALAWIKSILPERVVKGLIVLTPKEIHDISPTKDTKEKFLAEQNQKDM
jgi:predicted pyridoxine 5'-phosphate oxidase superfamily flavin-nucleotide-binding protein